VGLVVAGFLAQGFNGFRVNRSKMSGPLSYLGSTHPCSLLMLHGLFGNKNNFSSILKSLVKNGLIKDIKKRY
jgi:hypothetical protein